MSTFNDFKHTVLTDLRLLLSHGWQEAVDTLAVELQCAPTPEAILEAAERLSFDDMEGLCAVIDELTGHREEEWVEDEEAEE